MAVAGSPHICLIVNGLPASGKSMLAAHLAAATGWPCLAKDVFTEILFDQLGGGDRAWSERLGRASLALLYRTAAVLPTVILDGPFDRTAARADLARFRRPVVEVYCRCPLPEARRRFAERWRHLGHGDEAIGPAEWARWAAAYGEPVAAGPVIEVDTSVRSDVADLVPRIRAHAAPSPPR